jgi:hypothetical protein
MVITGTCRLPTRSGLVDGNRRESTSATSIEMQLRILCHRTTEKEQVSCLPGLNSRLLPRF